MTHCVRWTKEDLGDQTPGQNVQLEIAAASWRIQSRNWLDGDFAFYRISLELV